MSAKRVAKVKSILKTVIRSVCRKKQMFVKDPKRDFTRERKGYRLLAADGSDIHVAANPLDPASYFPGANGQTAYNLQHLDALYDILQKSYLDAEVIGRKKSC